MKEKIKKFLPIIVVAFFGILASYSLLHKGMLPTHDGEYHIVRFYEFNKVLRSGDLYPRWAPDINKGYGAPLFNYVYPLPNYVSSVMHLLGISFIDAFKLNMFFATIIGSVFFYLWAKQFWGKLGGVVSSVFYTFSPYHFVDIYIRGSAGEVWALGFFPAFLWAYTKFVNSRRKVFLILSSIFLALIIFSHNILALMFFIFALAYAFFLIYYNNNKKYLIITTLYIILIGLGLSAIFWLPAIYEAKYVEGLQIFDVAAHFPELYQLLFPSWGSGFSGADLGSVLSFQIGAANLLVIFLSAIIIALMVKEKSKKLPYTVFFFACFIFILFLMLKISLPLWRTIPFMNYFQFPWRLLSIAIIPPSFLAGSIFSVGIRSKSVKLVLAILLIFVAYILGIGYAKPAYYMDRADDYYATRSNFVDGTNSPGNVFNTIWFNKELKKQKEKIVISDGKVESSILNPTYHSYSVSIVSASKATINIAYFPSWTVYVDKKKIAKVQDANGLISFPVPSGSHLIELKFEDTPIRIIAKIISVLAFFSILFYSSKWYNFFRLNDYVREKRR